MDEERIIWICPTDNTYNSGNFCIRCGCPRPATLQTEASEPAPEEASITPLKTEEPEVPGVPEVLELDIPAEAAPEEAPPAEEKRELCDDGGEEPTGEENHKDDRIGLGDRVKELWGDVKASFSRTELAQDIKEDRKNKAAVIAGAVGAFLLLFLIFALLIAPRMGLCIFGHRWSEANCTKPMTCLVCGKTKGETVSHKFDPATCTEPETCRVCGAVNGEPLGHDWQSATCTEASICTRCGERQGEPNGHVPGETRVITAPTALEPGEEEVLCAVCGAALETHPCSMTSYIDGDRFAFTMLDYTKLLVTEREEILPELSMLTYTNVGENDCLAFWLDDAAAGTARVATCMFYDEQIQVIPVTEEHYGDKPYAIQWTFEQPWNMIMTRRLLPYVLSTLSPSPIDGEMLIGTQDVTVDGLRYIYENNGKVCHITVLTSKACENELAAGLLLN